MPGVGVGVIILNDLNQVLLILRNEDKDKALSDMRLEGTWTLPAGKVKLNETIFDAAKRKALSEVNLTVDELSVVSLNDDINEFAHFLTVGVLARMWTGEVSLGDTMEHVDYAFFDFDKLPSNLCGPSKVIINNYRNNRIYEEN